MATVSVVLICVAAALVCAVLRAAKPEMALGVTLAAGVAALALLGDDLKAAAQLIIKLAGQAAVPDASAGLLLRAAGIALMAEFGAELCRDAGESALAGRIDLAARVALLVMAVPLIEQILALIAELLA